MAGLPTVFLGQLNLDSVYPISLYSLRLQGSEIPAFGDRCKTPQPPPPPSGGLLLPWLLTGGYFFRRCLVNRVLSEQPGLRQSGSPLGGGDGKLSYSKVSLRRNDGREFALACGS